jgi:hypothetical protein
VTNYVANFQLLGSGSPKVPSSCPDGASITVMLYERYGKCQTQAPNPWASELTNADAPLAFFDDTCTTLGGTNAFNGTTNPWAVFQSLPKPTACDSSRTQSLHTSGITILLADSSVRSVASSVTAANWSAAVTPRGSDIVEPDW